jgi:hypothetical protein
MRRNPDERTDRGQAHTLESVVGAVILLTAIAFALQVTIVTPLSASTSSQHIESQQRSVAQGVLANAADSGALQEAVLYWNNTGGRFHNTPVQQFYTNDPPDNRFGNMLSRAFNEEGIAYNVRVYYQTGNVSTRTEINQKLMISQGTPSDNAVSATRTITLRNDDHLVDEDGSLNETTVSESDTFYIKNAHTGASGAGDGNGLYNVVQVEVVSWRI